MGLEGAVRTLLLGNGTITGLVGDRIRPVYGAQTDKRPLLTISITNNQGGITHSGSTGTRKATVEIGIIADKYADADALAVASFGALNGYAGTVGDVRIAPSVYDDETDVEQVTPPGQSRPEYLKTIQFRVRYQAA